MDYDYYDYEDVEEAEWIESWPRDVKIDEAKEELRKFFNENDEKVYYLQQLEVFFERKPYKIYHWITAKAVNELIEEGDLGKEKVDLLKDTSVKFVFDKKLRYYKLLVRKSIEVIRQYSNYEIAIACGRQAEVLFFNALLGRGFLAKGQNTREHNGEKWTQTDHDLDFIIEKDRVVYGCEVKNKWAYIGREELEIKLEMCRFLHVRPLFIMRHSPQPYNWEIVKRGGYAMIFETQIYPFGQRSLVEKIKEVLGLPVDCPRAIPEGIIDRFLRWHERVAGV